MDVFVSPFSFMNSSCCQDGGCHGILQYDQHAAITWPIKITKEPKPQSRISIKLKKKNRPVLYCWTTYLLGLSENPVSQRTLVSLCVPFFNGQNSGESMLIPHWLGFPEKKKKKASHDQPTIISGSSPPYFMVKFPWNPPKYPQNIPKYIKISQHIPKYPKISHESHEITVISAGMALPRSCGEEAQPRKTARIQDKVRTS